ncbi:MAG: ACP S-malonyltransferase [Desulfarculus sp.]|nr:ACP S-malonyltransferase [Desulfarculus sp.]
MSAIAVVFPGQGSQYVGMGQAFCEASPTAKAVFETAEAVSTLAIQRLCFEGPLEELTQTVNLQPAVVAVDLACWLALKEAGIAPVAVAGHSLGEYPALVAAGAISPEECLKLVSLRGRLMEREANAHPGAMSAIMGLNPEQVMLLTQEAGGVVQPANYNTPSQTVITGAAEAVAAANALAKTKGAKAIPLKVSGAWHSPLMETAGVDMRAALEGVNFQPLTCAHLPNTIGQPTRDASVAKDELMRQLTSPVRWVQTIEALLAMGVDTFIEAGPKNVLAGLIRKTAPDTARVFNVEDPASLRATLTALA